MVKGLKCYSGSTILGYKLCLPRLAVSGYVNNSKNVGLKETGKSNNNILYCLSKVKKINYKK